jgi:hypothetical protein
MNDVQLSILSVRPHAVLGPDKLRPLLRRLAAGSCECRPRQQTCHSASGGTNSRPNRHTCRCATLAGADASGSLLLQHTTASAHKRRQPPVGPMQPMQCRALSGLPLQKKLACAAAVKRNRCVGVHVAAQHVTSARNTDTSYEGRQICAGRFTNQSTPKQNRLLYTCTTTCRVNTLQPAAQCVYSAAAAKASDTEPLWAV